MPYIAWFDAGKLQRPQVGGKGAALSELSAAGFQVPPGFCITADGYRHYESSTGLEARIASLMDGVDTTQPQSVREAATAICEMVRQTPLPEDLQAEIASAYGVLMQKQEIACAVRSSATSEDGSAASFAGLYETYLNVRGVDDVLQCVHDCYVSLWGERAVGYRARKAGHAVDEAMAVVVMGLVPSETSGIAFTAHPVTGSLDQVVINASFGLGEAIVSGRVTPDSFVVSKQSFAILEREIYPKEIATYPNPDGHGTVDIALAADVQKKPSLTDDQACEVARLAAKVEQHYGLPQDIEWGLASDSLYLLQARPITTL
jgi:pyruvate,water dikinase